MNILQKLFRGKVNKGEFAAKQTEDKYSTYPSNGLTPQRLAEILREADVGDVMRQMELFEEMEEKDPHLFSQLQTRKNAVTGLDYEIIPYSDDERDKQIATFVEAQLNELDMEDITMDLLDAIGKGIAVSEIIWDVIGDKVVVKDIKRRHQKRFLWDDQDVFKVTTKEAPNGIELPNNKFITHTYKAKSGHPSRAGILRVVAWMYLFKNYDLKDWVSFAEVFGMPIRLGKYSAGANDDDKRALMQALIDIGTDAAGIMPDSADIELKEGAKQSSSDLYERLARYCDEQMSKAILGQTLTSDSGGGSYAQSKTHNEVRHDLTVADAKALAATIKRDLIKPIVMFNFGETHRIPTLQYDSEEEADLKQYADILSTLVGDVGLKVPSEFVYKKFGIPEPETGEAIVQPTQVNNPIEPSVNKYRMIANNAKPNQAQVNIDQLAHAAIQTTDGLFKQLFEPMMALVAKAETLEEIKAVLDDDKKLLALMNNMDSGVLDQVLHNSLVYANLEGRASDEGH